MKALPALLLLLLPLLGRAAPVFAVSDVHTFRFGVEQDWPASTRVDARHTDLVIPYCGGGGNFTIVADPPPSAQTFALTGGHLYANASTRQTMPTPIPSGYGFIGAAAGTPFWTLQQSSFSGQLYLGIETPVNLARLAAWNPGVSGVANTSAKWMEVRLIAVRGPVGGQFALFQYTTGAPRVYMATSDGITVQDRVFLTSGGHDHFNWTFTKAGLYEIDLRAATTVEDTPGNFQVLSVHAPGGSTPLVSWESDPCYRYTLQSSSSPATSGPWAAVPGAEGLPGLGGTQHFADPTAGTDRRYYRVFRIP